MFVSHSVCLDSEAQEPDECVRQVPQVSGVQNCADCHVHTAAPCCDCHQDPSHYTEEGEDIGPRHGEMISFAYFSTEVFCLVICLFLFLVVTIVSYLWTVSSDWSFNMKRLLGVWLQRCSTCYGTQQRFKIFYAISLFLRCVGWDFSHIISGTTDFTP